MKKLIIKNPKVSKKVATPVGRLLWMNLADPTPANSPMQPNKYTCTVAWDKNDKMQAPAIKGLVDAILEVARTAYGDDTVTMQDLKDNNLLSVIKDGGTMKEYLTGLCVTSASTDAKYPPKVYGPVMAQGELSKDDISRLSNGDYGRMVITVSAYQVPGLKKHGITAYLSLVQFARKGEYLGGSDGGKNLLDDLDVGEVSDDEKALLETLPLQDKVEPAPKKEEPKAEPKKEEPRAEREVTPVKEEPKAEEPVSDSSFDDMFNF